MDDHQHAVLLQRLRDGEAWLAPVPARGRRDQQLAVGALRGAPGLLRVSPLPQRQAHFKEMASSGVALNVAMRVIKKTRAKPVMMIQNPYLSLSRSISSEVGGGVVSCLSTKGPILSASFTGVVAFCPQCSEGDESAMNRRELGNHEGPSCGAEFTASRADAKTCSATCRQRLHCQQV